MSEDLFVEKVMCTNAKSHNPRFAEI